MSENVPSKGPNIPKGTYEELPLDRIVPGKNPRQNIDQQSLASLAESIRRNGLIHPIMVQPTGMSGTRRTDETYSIISGERRYRAAKMIGMTTIRVTIRRPDNESDALALALAENIERENLNPIDEARGFLQLREYGWRVMDIAERFGRADSTISNSIRLLQLPEAIQKKIAVGSLAPTTGRDLLRYMDNPELMQAGLDLAEAGVPQKKILKLVESGSRASHIGQAKKKEYGDPIDFRGLRHVPIGEQGVVYLFGMVSHELGFLIESVQERFPDCEGKRCVDKDRGRWERVLIEFEFESGSFRIHGHDVNGCDLIVCWEHNWPDCPLEVLELKSAIKQLSSAEKD